MENYPKVLVLSHNCFSKSGSNGRTLTNFFKGWSKDKLAQFYISSETPDCEVCDKYFRVTDMEVIKSFIKKDKCNIIDQKKTNKKTNKFKEIYQMFSKKNSINYIIRNFIWNKNNWWDDNFDNWLEKFNPEVILIQLGDYSFMLKLALKIAKNRNIPIVIYNSEDYFFKDKKSLSPFYYYYRNDYKKQVKEIISYSSHSIYNSEILQETYNKGFKHKSSVIMTSTDIIGIKNKKIGQIKKISYLGNLSVGRYESLIEIGECLNKIKSNIKLDIYGEIPNKKIKKYFESCSGINLKGFISYNKVVEVMKESDLLVHAENFSEFYRWDLKHAFSTKIADSLASGTLFFMYGPPELVSTKYLLENKVAVVVTEKKELEKKLKELILDKKINDKKVLKALEIVEKNHNIENNRKLFKEIIIESKRG